MEVVNSQSLNHPGVHHAQPRSFAKKMKTKLTKAKNSRSKIHADDVDAKQAGTRRMFSDVSNAPGHNYGAQNSKVVKPNWKPSGGNRVVVQPKVSKKVVHKPVEICPPIKSESKDVFDLSQFIESDVRNGSLPEGVIDIDYHEQDYFKEPVYAEDVMAYLREQEDRYVIPRNYLDDKDVNHSMRSVLVDWLTQVQDHLGLEQETLHLAVMFVDHFFHRKAISVPKVQLVGITCLFVAAKYVERFAPEIKDLVRLTDNTYTYEQVIRMELVVLKVLRFELHMPEPTVFLSRFLDIEPVTQEVRHLSNYLLDLSLPDATCVTLPSSIKAAAAVALAQRILNKNMTSWSKTVGWYTGYMSESSLHPVMRRYIALLQRLPSTKQTGAYNKYSSRSKYGAIAKAAELHPTGLLNKILVSLMH